MVELHNYMSLSVQASITNYRGLKDKHLFITVLVAGSTMSNKGSLWLAESNMAVFLLDPHLAERY